MTQENTAIFPLQTATPVQLVAAQAGPAPTAMVMQPMAVPPNVIPPSTQQELNVRVLRNGLSPDIATKSLSALKGRKEEIISELGDIVGPSAAKAIGDITYQQASSHKFGLNDMKTQPTTLVRRRSGSAEPGGGGGPGGAVAGPGALYGIWTSKPLITMSSLIKSGSRPVSSVSESPAVDSMIGATYYNPDGEEDIPLPEGICVSRFGPISRRNLSTISTSSGMSLARTVTARNEGSAIEPTSLVRPPLPSASPMKENVVLVSDQNEVLQYPSSGGFLDYTEGMDSLSMQHLVNPPAVPASPMPNPRDMSTGLTSNNYNMFVETNRIQLELEELQRRISCLSVAENSAKMAIKRDRLAFELRMVQGGIQVFMYISIVRIFFPVKLCHWD